LIIDENKDRDKGFLEVIEYITAREVEVSRNILLSKTD